MHRLLTMKRLSILFLSIFAVLLAGMFAYENLVVAPGDRCEAGGKWWDPEGRECAQPISIAEITGRPNPGERAAASAEKNRELVAIERRLAVERTARAAAIERDRQALVAKQAY